MSEEKNQETLLDIIQEYLTISDDLELNTEIFREIEKLARIGYGHLLRIINGEITSISDTVAENLATALLFFAKDKTINSTLLKDRINRALVGPTNAAT